MKRLTFKKLLLAFISVIVILLIYFVVASFFSEGFINRSFQLHDSEIGIIEAHIYAPYILETHIQSGEVNITLNTLPDSTLLESNKVTHSSVNQEFIDSSRVDILGRRGSFEEYSDAYNI